jgi:hypothetical protein
VAEIQRRVVKQSKRNAIYRVFKLRGDKCRISTWKLELDKALRAFNVRSVRFVYSPLNVLLQTELSIHTHLVVSDVRRDVVNTQAMVSDVRCDISKTNAIVSAGATNTNTALANMHNVILQGVANTEVIISKLQGDVSGAQGTVSSVQGPLVENKEERDLSVSNARIPPLTKCMLITS